MYKAGSLRSFEEGAVFWMTREEFSASSDVMWDVDKILEIHDNADHSELFYPMGSENGTILA
ncbi:hypothetical protein [Butyrivibrio fibrisolvens]|uniref:hypothetical protein n=1 Tax=Butyrivibrio fibrisolvens TaxID=831 RepID=UPI0011B25F9D|nr:hypothetical protein [Butyrivibrio fibrisolvens]